ncbi:MAG TPA: zinc-binding dehydrogenase [Bacteroidales bacterium]|nr:zinc-binding dehydrogenase [Bacteroidales bacterium]
MLASVIESPRSIIIREMAIPEIKDEDVLVKLDGTGLCSSNLPVWEGREWFTYPIEPGSPGHEGYGTVVQAGKDVRGIDVGDKVALISYNAYAEFDKAHYSNVVRLPQALIGTPFLGEPAACVVNIFKRSDIQPGQKVLVIGSGFMGSLMIQLIKNAGAEVVAVSRRQTSVQFAEKAGADQIVRFSDVSQCIDDLYKLSSAGFSRIIEVTGSQNAIDLASEMISIRGKMIIAGYHQNGLRTVNMQSWNWKGIDVINAHERDPNIYTEGLKEAIHLTELNILRPNDFITHQFDLQSINKAFETLHDRPEGFIKAIITYS